MARNEEGLRVRKRDGMQGRGMEREEGDGARERGAARGREEQRERKVVKGQEERCEGERGGARVI